MPRDALGHAACNVLSQSRAPRARRRHSLYETQLQLRQPNRAKQGCRCSAATDGRRILARCVAVQAQRAFASCAAHPAGTRLAHLPATCRSSARGSRARERRDLDATVPTLRTSSQECKELQADGCHDLAAEPLEDNLFEWHFAIRGPPDTDFEARASTRRAACTPRTRGAPTHSVTARERTLPDNVAASPARMTRATPVAPTETTGSAFRNRRCRPPAAARQGGIYHGRILLPPEYPFKPPSFSFLTARAPSPLTSLQMCTDAAVRPHPRSRTDASR